MSKLLDELFADRKIEVCSPCAIKPVTLNSTAKVVEVEPVVAEPIEEKVAEVEAEAEDAVEATDEAETTGYSYSSKKNKRRN